MRDTKILLGLVKTELIKKTHLKAFNKAQNDNSKVYWGLCHTIFSLRTLDIITCQEELHLDRLIRLYEKKRLKTSTLSKPFFDAKGSRSNSTWGGDFLWKPKAIAPRLRWLDKQMK